MARGRRVLGEQRAAKRAQAAAAQEAKETLWEAFEQAQGRLARQWGRGAWRTLEEDLKGVEWGDDGVRLTVTEMNPGTERKVAFLSAAMADILGRPFIVEAVAVEAVTLV